MIHRRAWNLIDCMVALLALLIGTSTTFQLSQSTYRHQRLHREYAVAWRILSQVSRQHPQAWEGPMYFDSWGVLQSSPSHHVLTGQSIDLGPVRQLQYTLTFRDSRGQTQHLTAQRHMSNQP